MGLVNRVGARISGGGIGHYVLNEKMMEVVERLEATEEPISGDEQLDLENKLGLRWLDQPKVKSVNNVCYSGVGYAEGVRTTVDFPLDPERGLVTADLMILRPGVGVELNSRYITLLLNTNETPHLHSVVANAGALIRKEHPEHHLAQLIGATELYSASPNVVVAGYEKRELGIAEVHLAQGVLKAYQLAREIGSSEQVAARLVKTTSF